MKIRTIESNSIGEKLGLKAGDDVRAINGDAVGDILDYRFLIADEEIDMEVVTAAGRVIYEIEKNHDDDLGLGFEDIQIRHCGNDCPFCFVDQNPVGMRESMYFRDEDYRLSFLSGHYVTLTNLAKRDLDRIVRQQLSPLFVSVHATDAEVRKFLFGIKHDDRLLPKLEFLTGNGIEIHTQVVLCPRVNDGKVLQQTIADLAHFLPNLRSVSVVPLGLTRHRHGRQKLQAVTADYARDYLTILDNYAAEFVKKNQEHFVYPGDEFYLLAGRPIPAAGRYDGFYQKENGVGMVRWLLDDFKRQQTLFPPAVSSPTRATFVTAPLAKEFMQKKIIAALNSVDNFAARLVVVENEFYGHSIQVTGLLTAGDIYNKLAKIELGEKVYLPANCLKDDTIFLDDWTVDELSEKLECPVEPLHNDFGACFRGK